jgi:hypothetical protein
MMRPLETLWIRNFISEKCRKAVDGPWLHNGLHTEPMMIIDLVNGELAKNLESLQKKIGKLTITGVVIGVNSKFDICFACQRLLQGLQWNLQSILKKVVEAKTDLKAKIEIDKDFATAIIAKTMVGIKTFDRRQSKSRTIGGTILNQDLLPVLGGGRYGKYPRHQLILNERHD